MHKVEISLTLPESERKIFLGSLEPEILNPIPKTQINITETNAGVLLTITAETTSSLRAALNSYLRWLHSISEISENIDLTMA